ncbi:MAG TPA: mannosyltransferase family protein [Solirubrobacteraceae bacterium]|nr:mannosyltransferase family protein [Solirubrobacteraceae bacterium]
MGQDAIPGTAGLAIARPAAAWRPALGRALRAAVLTRLGIWAAGVWAVALWGTAGGAWRYDPAGVTRPYGRLGDALVAPLARWDSVWYLAIAHDGYPAQDPQRPAFFPLYPALVHAAGAVLGSPLVAGALLSAACAIAAFVLLARLTELELGPQAARWALWALALFPASFFLGAVYSEALFLALSIGAVYAARTARWPWAGALAALAGGTRSAGVLLVVPLALLWWSARPRRARDAPWLLGAPAGLAAFCAWLALRGGSASAPFHAQDLWFRHFAGPFVGVWDGAVAAWDGARQLLSGSRAHVYFTHAGGDPFVAAGHDLLLFAFLLLALPALWWTFRRLPAAYGAYSLAALALPLSWPVAPQPLMSLPRFELVLFPLFMAGGAWLADGGMRRRAVVLGAFAVGLAVLTAQFATWHWVA